MLVTLSSRFASLPTVFILLSLVITISLIFKALTYDVNIGSFTFKRLLMRPTLCPLILIIILVLFQMLADSVHRHRSPLLALCRFSSAELVRISKDMARSLEINSVV